MIFIEKIFAQTFSYGEANYMNNSFREDVH